MRLSWDASGERWASDYGEDGGDLREAGAGEGPGVETKMVAYADLEQSLTA